LASGELDLNAVARHELASRGLDWNGQWIGFEKAKALAECYPVRRGNRVVPAVNCLDSDILVTKSPFYTYAPFCSPCVPGAGNLDSTVPIGIEAPYDRDEQIRTMSTMGVKTYCFAHERRYCPMSDYGARGLRQ